MQWLYQLSVTRRLAALVTLTLLSMLALLASMMVSERSLLLDERAANVRQVVETAHGIAVHYHALAAKGQMSDAEAQQRAMETCDRCATAATNTSGSTTWRRACSCTRSVPSCRGRI